MPSPAELALRMATNGGGSGPHVGALPSPVAGRTDHLPISVPAGAYVLPADVVSSLGEHNTLAGFKVLDAMFKGPFGMNLPQVNGRGPGIPGAGHAPRAAGGRAPIDIVAAGGEYVIPPEAVAAVGGGDLEKGHDILDHFVRAARAKSIKTLRKLPGPKVD